MTLLLVLRAVAADAVFAVVALGLGELALAAVERLVEPSRELPRPPSLARLGAALLVGLGVAASVGVALGLAHVFGRASLALATAAALLASRRALLRYARYLRARGPAARELLFGSRLRLAGFLLGGILFAVNYQAALAPPTAWDELAYHLPQARRLADTHTLPLTLGNHYFQTSHFFYGNIPKLGEVLYAEGIAFSGFALARALHMTVLAAFLLLVFGRVRALFGEGAAVLSVVLLLLYDHLVRNASSAYVDAATASLEVGAVLALATWAFGGDLGDAAQAALLIGFALSFKYSPLSTLVFLALLFGIAVARRRWPLARVRPLALRLTALALLPCAFWYVKNAIRYGNPFYPLYLGHPGVSEAEYRRVLLSVQQFQVPRTLSSFLRFPRWLDEPRDVPAFLGLSPSRSGCSSAPPPRSSGRSWRTPSSTAPTGSSSPRTRCASCCPRWRPR